jgi:hypothetical protein
MPPPQEIRQGSLSCRLFKKAVSRSRKASSPARAKKLAMLSPRASEIQASLSSKGRERASESAAATVDLPLPMKPIRKRWRVRAGTASRETLGFDMTDSFLNLTAIFGDSVTQGREALQTSAFFSRICDKMRQEK